MRPDDSLSRSALDPCRHPSNKETVASLHVADRPIMLKSKVDQISKVNPVEDGCCPFKIVFDEGLYVVFDEDLYVHFICILLCFKYVLGSA